MLCDTCQRQPNCLTHQLADQDPTLYRMLEQLQGCQRKLAQPHQLRVGYMDLVVRLIDQFFGMFRRCWYR